MRQKFDDGEDPSRTHLGDFPLDLDKVSLSNSSGRDHVVHRAICRCIIKFWQFIPLIDNNIIIVCARHTDNIYLAIIVGPKQNTVHVCIQSHY